jgi:hypothetical protein
MSKSKIFITPRARSIFAAMKGASDKEMRVRLLGDLHDELKLPPYQWPPVLDPKEEGGDEDAKALWAALDKKR